MCIFDLKCTVPKIVTCAWQARGYIGTRGEAVAPQMDALPSPKRHTCNFFYTCVFRRPNIKLLLNYYTMLV